MSKAQKVLVLFVGIVFIIYIASQQAPNTGTQTATDTQGETAKPKDAESEPVVSPPAVGEPVNHAYFNYVRKEANYPCYAALKKEAIYGFRGTGLFGFTRPEYVNKQQRGDGHLIFACDDAEVQDKFGKWVLANYRCEWDPAEKRVVSVTIDLGKLPQALGR
jgi:hypothetical protein